MNVAPCVLTYDQTEQLCRELIDPQDDDSDFLLEQFTNRIVPGVDDTSKLKANFLYDIASQTSTSPLITPVDGVKWLGTMQGGYSIEALTKLLDNEEVAKNAAAELSKNILVFDYFHDVQRRSDQGNPYARAIIRSWADADWFTSTPRIPERLTITAFKVSGEINTDDLSPAQDAWSRPDIPLHARSMLKMPREGIVPDEPGDVGPIQQILELQSKGHPVAFIGDVVGTGSSRKSATNSLLWYFGDEIPHVPNKKRGGLCIGGQIAPIFFNTMEDSGALPIEMPVEEIQMGDVIDIYPYEGVTKRHDTREVICRWTLKTDTIYDSVRAGGRINLIIGKALTQRAKTHFQDKSHSLFTESAALSRRSTAGYTLAQKMVGKACGLRGVRPGTYCEPIVTSVGSQDTTGPMTRDELKDLACLGFNADLVMQSFCHTAAYPKPVDVVTHNTLPPFIQDRGGISLRPGDGIIHSWLNRMLLPDTVGTGGDSHTRFPIGISFPAGSGLVAFAAATGVMPLDMPESVLVRFSGELQPGITLRDVVHYIPYVARQRGVLTLDKQNKKNPFAGRILEIEGLDDLTCTEAFELSDASAERSAAGCTIALSVGKVEEYLCSNIQFLRWMVDEGYNDRSAIERRIGRMEEWLRAPALLRADSNAEYAETFEIDLNELKEPVLCAPNDPDHAVLLSEVSGDTIDEVFIGSCMTNVGHFRDAGKALNEVDKLNSKLWIAPPTKMDETVLIDEGYYDIFEKLNTSLEMPGCSLCMGNQARVADKATVLSTSTRNFPNRLGKGADVYLASAKLCSITAIEGKIPSLERYLSF